MRRQAARRRDELPVLLDRLLIASHRWDLATAERVARRVRFRVVARIADLEQSA